MKTFLWYLASPEDGKRNETELDSNFCNMCSKGRTLLITTKLLLAEGVCLLFGIQSLVLVTNHFKRASRFVFDIRSDFVRWPQSKE